MITDLVMPGMNGRELAERLTHLHPEIRVLYVSGYVDSARTPLDALAFPLLEKPFGADLLVRKVRETLDSPGVAMAADRARAPRADRP